jgi:hypothetical protein
MLQVTRAFGLAVALAVLAPKVAAADDAKERCVAAYEDAQRLRKAADLTGAREKLSICANDACPELARQDCTTWLREVDASMPTIIVSARDEAGTDIETFRVIVDDQLLPVRAGLATEVNPGAHRLRIEADGFSNYEAPLVANEREKGRLIRATLHPKAASVLVVTTPTVTKPTTDVTADAPSWPWPYAAGAVALGFLTVGIVYDAIGSSDLQHLRNTCAPNCAQAQLDSVKNSMAIGDGLLVAGLVTAVAAVVLWFVRPSAPKAASFFPLRGSF